MSTYDSNHEGSLTVHECGHYVQVIEAELAPHFVVDGLHTDMCRRCFRNLINDWIDERWRFWTPEEWEKMVVWQKAVADIEEELED